MQLYRGNKSNGCNRIGARAGDAPFSLSAVICIACLARFGNFPARNNGRTSGRNDKRARRAFASRGNSGRPADGIPRPLRPPSRQRYDRRTLRNQNIEVAVQVPTMRHSMYDSYVVHYGVPSVPAATSMQVSHSSFDQVSLTFSRPN